MDEKLDEKLDEMLDEKLDEKLEKLDRRKLAERNQQIELTLLQQVGYTNDELTVNMHGYLESTEHINWRRRWH